MRELKVEVELKAACVVDGVKRKAGDVVALPESIAADFGHPPMSPEAREAARKRQAAEAEAKAKAELKQPAPAKAEKGEEGK